MDKFVQINHPESAVRWRGDNFEEIKKMCGDAVRYDGMADCMGDFIAKVWLFGEEVKPGDYILKDPYYGGFRTYDGKKFQEDFVPAKEFSDGYHTVDELYRYRVLYNALAFNELAKNPEYRVIKSVRHSDGNPCFGSGWFVVMADLPTGQVSNHYQMKYWSYFKCKEVDRAREWDGHTPKEAADRMEEFLKKK